MANQFQINKVQPHKNFNEKGFTTPNVEFSEGIRPAGNFAPAPYLPLVRYEGNDFDVYTVISAGKVVALDSKGFLVPAGLADTASKVAYTQLDVDNGVVGANGVAVTAGELVSAQLTAATITVSAPVGVAPYNYFQNSGGDGSNPALFNFANFNHQSRVVFLTDYVLELPVVAEADYANAPLKGIASVIAEKDTLKPGDFLTFDGDSNFKVDDAPDLKKTIGQVIQVVKGEDPMLGLVRTADNGGGVLNQMHGTATQGKHHAISYSGGHSLVRVNLINR